MIARIENRDLFRKEDVSLRVTITDESGVAVDLTGATIRWRLCTAWGGAATLDKTITEALTASGQIDDPTNGRALIKIADTDTTSLSIFRETKTVYYHSVKVKDAAAEYRTTTYGEVRFLKERQPSDF